LPLSVAEASAVVVTRIGADGDGVAATETGGALYVPFTLPGETVRPGDPAEILTFSAERVVPPCRHFGSCGGCSLQHWQDDAYAAWKAGLLTAALRRAGYDEPAVAPLVRTPAGARRRIDLAIRRHGATLTVGLHGRGSGAVVDLAECPVLHPDLAALIGPIRALARSLSAVKREGSAVLNLLDTGPDLLMRTDAPASTGDRARFAGFAREHGVARIAIAVGRQATEIASQQERPFVVFDGVRVTPPPGAFLQASAVGEAAIRAAVVAGLPEKLTSKSRVAELHAGCGTLTFALAGRVRVEAFEGDAAASGALRAAVQAAALGRIGVQTRDLVRQPLMAKELSGYAAVVLDPPFGGAGPQMAEIARSGIGRVIYVSCNPAVLAREARVLRDAGYALLSAVPVDQFLWSARLESVTVFGRGRR
jgi:23S rRNA (uracil1939-C5)-methyltransferase